MNRGFTNLTICDMGVIIIYSEAMQGNLEKIGYRLYSILGYKIAFIYPSWIKRLLK